MSLDCHPLLVTHRTAGLAFALRQGGSFEYQRKRIISALLINAYCLLNVTGCDLSESVTVSHVTRVSVPRRSIMVTCDSECNVMYSAVLLF
jgi:hypothetical protein